MRRREHRDATAAGLECDRAVANLLRSGITRSGIGPVRLVIEANPRDRLAFGIAGQAGLVEQGTRVLLRLDDRLHMNQVAPGVKREAQLPRERLALQSSQLDEAALADTLHRGRLQL